MTAMGMRSDLVAFIAARLDDDEAAAKVAAESEWWAHVVEFASANHYDAFGDLAVDYWRWFPGEADGVHVARHDPARVLRQLTAMRHVLFACNKFREQDALYILLSLAAIWQDHADYRQEWAPDS